MEVGEEQQIMQQVTDEEGNTHYIIQPIGTQFTEGEGNIIQIPTDEDGNLVMQVAVDADGVVTSAENQVYATYDINEVQAGEHILEFANAISSYSKNKEDASLPRTVEEVQVQSQSEANNKGKEIVPVTSGIIVEGLVRNLSDGKIPSTVAASDTVDDDQAIQVLTSLDDLKDITDGDGNQHIVIDSLSGKNVQNLKTEVLPDGTIQVYFMEDESVGEQETPANATFDNGAYYIEELPKNKVDNSCQPAMISVTTKEFRDVATQITCFPKFSRQGLYDVSTQVSSRDINRAPLATRQLPAGTKIIQNSIKSANNESTVVLNAGDNTEVTFFKCNICGKIYKHKLNWQNHITTHAREKVYMCGHCGKIYQKANMASHLRTHSELRQIAVFENLPDDMKRKNHKSIPGYKANIPEASIIELELADVTCEINEADFPPPAAITTEPETEVTVMDDETEPVNVVIPENEQVFFESEIPAKMEVEAEAEIQEGTCKTKFVFKCNVCGKEYNNKSNCHRHLKSHTTDKHFKCGYCGKAFTHRYEVRMHCRIHTGERPFKCPICTRAFNESGNLRRHMKIHTTDESPFKCGVCFKGFDNTTRLNAHMKVHTGDIVCDICNRKFGKISDLYRHIRIHTGERPYKCTLCEKSFCQRVNLTSHMRTHTGQKAFRCDICQMGFTRKVALDYHMKTHEAEDEYETNSVVERQEVAGVKDVTSTVEVMEADVIESLVRVDKGRDAKIANGLVEESKA